MFLTFALALALNAAPDAGPDDEEEPEAPAWRELGEGDGGLEAPSIANSGKRSTALTVKQVSGSGGTMHLAEKTVISCGRCGAPLALRSAALIDHVLDVGEKRYLLLGWSSGGSGTQSVHVLLVHVGPGGPELIDELQWYSTRGEAGILLASTPQGWRVGFPQLPTGDEEYDQDYGSSLKLGAKEYRKASHMAKTGFFKPVSAGLVAFAYCPPSGKGMRLHGHAGWLRVTATGFKTP